MVAEYSVEHPSQWSVIESIAGKIDCTAHTLNTWVRQPWRDTGQRESLLPQNRSASKMLRRANEIPKPASAFFAKAELDRRIQS